MEGHRELPLGEAATSRKIFQVGPAALGFTGRTAPVRVAEVFSNGLRQLTFWCTVQDKSSSAAPERIGSGCRRITSGDSWVAGGSRPCESRDKLQNADEVFRHAAAGHQLGKTKRVEYPVREARVKYGAFLLSYTHALRPQYGIHSLPDVAAMPITSAQQCRFPPGSCYQRLRRRTCAVPSKR